MWKLTDKWVIHYCSLFVLFTHFECSALINEHWSVSWEPLSTVQSDYQEDDANDEPCAQCAEYALLEPRGHRVPAILLFAKQNGTQSGSNPVGRC